MNKEEGWFHTKSLVITQLKLLVLTLLTGENQDHSQRPNLPRTSTEGWHLAPALIVKCQNCTAHADSGHLLRTSISQWRSAWGTALVFSPVIWVTELDSSSVPLQSVRSFYAVKLDVILFTSSSALCVEASWYVLVCLHQTRKTVFWVCIENKFLYTVKLVFSALLGISHITVEWKVPNISSLSYVFFQQGYFEPL